MALKKIEGIDAARAAAIVHTTCLAGLRRGPLHEADGDIGGFVVCCVVHKSKASSLDGDCLRGSLGLP